MEAQHKAKFGYWGVRGAGQVIRFLLGYTKTPFEDVLYSAREKWFDEDKKNLGFDFPNLPYLIDGDFKLTESTAIMHYVINKSGHKDLLGKTLMDTAEVNRLIGVIGDAFKEVRGLVWNKEYDTAKGAVL